MCTLTGKSNVVNSKREYVVNASSRLLRNDGERGGACACTIQLGVGAAHEFLTRHIFLLKRPGSNEPSPEIFWKQLYLW